MVMLNSNPIKSTTRADQFIELFNADDLFITTTEHRDQTITFIQDNSEISIVSTEDEQLQGFEHLQIYTFSDGSQACTYFSPSDETDDGTNPDDGQFIAQLYPIE